VTLGVGATLMMAAEFGEEIVESETNPQTAMMNDDSHAAAGDGVDDGVQHQDDARPKIVPTMVTPNLIPLIFNTYF
jgi:hypothetical protein